MCGRFYLTAHPDQIIESFQLQRLPHYEASYNIAPGQKILSIVKLEDDSYKAVNLHWGLIPHWSKDNKTSAPLCGSPKDFGTPVAKIDSPHGESIMPWLVLRSSRFRTT